MSTFFSQKETQIGKAERVDKSPSSTPPFSFLVVMVLGYGLFRGVNSSSYLSAASSVEKPFLFIPDIFFNVIVAIATITTAAIVVVLTFRGKIPPLSMPYKMPVAFLLASNLAVAFGLFELLPADVAVFIPGVLFGISSVMLSLVWIEFLALQKPSAIVFQIALATLMSASISLFLSGFHPKVRAGMSCIMLIAMALCAWYVRKRLPIVIGTDNYPLPESTQDTGASGKRYRKVFLSIGDSLVAFFVLEAAIGILNSFMLAGRIDFVGSGSVSTIAMICGVLAFCIVVFIVQKLPKASTVFRVVAPALAAMLVFLPFLSEVYNLFFSTVIMGSYYFVALLMVYVIAEASHTYRVSPYIIMGITAGIARICLLTALLVGYAVGSAEVGPLGETEDTMRFLIIIVAVIYVLSMALVFISRGQRKRRDEDGDAKGEGSERNTDGQEEPEALKRTADFEQGRTHEQALEDRCRLLAKKYSLTDREAEIMVYLARGRTNAYIAKTLYVSENTVRSHVRGIYSKLNVHTRQELIDLAEGLASAEGPIEYTPI